MKRIILLLAILTPLTLFSQAEFRKGFITTQNGDTVSCLYQNGTWVLESDTSFVINVDTIRFSDGSTLATSTGLGAGDMTASVYDPQTIASDAFDRDNMTGTQGFSTIDGLADSLNKKIDGYVFEDILGFSGNTEIDISNFNDGSWEVPDAGSLSFGLYLYQDSGFPTGSNAPTLITFREKVGSTSYGYIALDDDDLVFSLFGGTDEVFVDITGLDSTYLRVYISWTSVSNVNVTINNYAVSHTTSGHSGSYFNDPTIGYGLGYLDNATIFDIKIFGTHQYNGWPNDNNTEGWVDLIGTSDGTINAGGIVLNDVQTNAIDSNRVLWLNEYINERLPSYVDNSDTAQLALKFTGDTLVLNNDTITEITPLNDSTLNFRINDQDYEIGSGSSNGSADSLLVSSSDTITLVGDTLHAENEHGAFKTIGGDSIYFKIDGKWVSAVDDSETLIADTIIVGSVMYIKASKIAGVSNIGAVGIENKDITIDSIIFNPVSSAEHQDGNLNYDDLTSSLVFKNDVDSTELNIGEEFRHRVYNNSGATILNNKAVRRTGSHTNGRRLPTIALSGIGSVDSAKVYGVTTHTIPNNSFGYVVKHGDVNFCNTSNLSEDESYLGFAGSQIDTMPYPPYKSIKVAEVIYSDNDSGIVDVDILDMGFSKTPTLSANYYDSSITVDIATQNVYQIITNNWYNSYNIIDEIGTNFASDSVQVLVSGQWNIAFTLSFQGTVSADTWKEGIFVNGVLNYSTERYTSSTATGSISGIIGLRLNAGDWVSFRMVNTTSARDFVVKNNSISLIFLHE